MILRKEDPQPSEPNPADGRVPSQPGADAALVTRAPKYPKPQVLLIDMEEQAASILQAAGYHVTTGSFGHPYSVSSTSQVIPFIGNGHLPAHFTEQDIVVVDVALTPLGPAPTAPPLPANADTIAVVKVGTGKLDPRPTYMYAHHKEFDRILEHGGIFVIFADERYSEEVIFGSVINNSFRSSDRDSFNNWCLLSLLSYIRVTADTGREMTEESELALFSFLSQHLAGANFSCTLESDSALVNQWVPLVHNKYGAAVGALILPTPVLPAKANKTPNQFPVPPGLGPRKGFVFIFPRLVNRGQFLVRFLQDIAPAVAPTLFPHIEGQRWVERPEYELPRVLELKAEIATIEATAQQQIAERQAAIGRERTIHGFLHALLRETGEPLVEAVRQALLLLGFPTVVDVDAERAARGDTSTKREDLRIETSGAPLLLVEVKGINNLPRESTSLQVWKYIAPRMRELQRSDIQGLAIINHQRPLPPLERENMNPFGPDVLANAEDQHFGLLTTWDLVRLVRSFLRYGWTHSQVQSLFYQAGRLVPVPIHYELIGTIEDFWERHSAVGVRLTAGSLAAYDRIAFELPVEFEEQVITSLQVERTAVAAANSGDLAGIQTHLTKAQARKGMRVFRVTSSISD